MKKVALVLLSVCLAASTFFGVLFVTSGVREVSAGDATAAEDDRRSAAISQQVNLATGGAQIPDVSSARRVYYVDAENGDDNNSGDIDSPLRTLLRVNRLELEPGDQVRFKCGGTWYGELLIRHSGAEGSPIVYSSYGEGAKPVIDGRGEVQAAVYGEDVSYIVVEGLEVTNNSEVDDQLRSGIHFEAVWETIYNLKILNCYVHDVSGAVGGPFDELDNEAYGAYLENYSMESTITAESSCGRSPSSDTTRRWPPLSITCWCRAIRWNVARRAASISHALTGVPKNRRSALPTSACGTTR